METMSKAFARCGDAARALKPTSLQFIHPIPATFSLIYSQQKSRWDLLCAPLRRIYPSFAISTEALFSMPNSHLFLLIPRPCKSVCARVFRSWRANLRVCVCVCHSLDICVAYDTVEHKGCRATYLYIQNNPDIKDTNADWRRRDTHTPISIYKKSTLSECAAYPFLKTAQRTRCPAHGISRALTSHRSKSPPTASTQQQQQQQKRLWTRSHKIISKSI